LSLRIQQIKAGLRNAARVIPAPIKRTLKRVNREIPPPTGVRWGDLRRQAPFDRNWGYARGTPVDRVYIETFLTQHAADIRGRCLEVLNDSYTRRYGTGRVHSSDILDINPANLEATVIADLGDDGSLPESRYDCFILTQTLHLVPDMGAALRNAHRALAPGGVLLLTVPGIGRHESRQGYEHDRWRLTPTGLRWLLNQPMWEELQVTSFGNVLTVVAMLYGLAAEELEPQELSFHDPDYPLIVSCRAKKSSG